MGFLKRLFAIWLRGGWKGGWRGLREGEGLGKGRGLGGRVGEAWLLYFQNPHLKKPLTYSREQSLLYSQLKKTEWRRHACDYPLGNDHLGNSLKLRAVPVWSRPRHLNLSTCKQGLLGPRVCKLWFPNRGSRLPAEQREKLSREEVKKRQNRGKTEGKLRSKWGAGIRFADQTRTTVWKPPFTSPWLAKQKSKLPDRCLLPIFVCACAYSLAWLH